MVNNQYFIVGKPATIAAERGCQVRSLELVCLFKLFCVSPSSMGSLRPASGPLTSNLLCLAYLSLCSSPSQRSLARSRTLTFKMRRYHG